VYKELSSLTLSPSSYLFYMYTIILGTGLGRWKGEKIGKKISQVGKGRGKKVPGTQIRTQGY